MTRLLRTAPLCAILLVLVGCASPRGSGVVATDHPLASEAGAEMLRRGGNAVDAAVAASLALSVVRPDACGIGGGGFMLVHLEDDPRHGTADVALNYRETCPAGIGPDTYADWGDPIASRDGGRAVGVPGTIAGLLHAPEHYGTLDRATVFAPAIRLAEEGWTADRHHVTASARATTKIAAHEGGRARFAFVDRVMTRGGRVSVGDPLRNPDQARALRRVVRDGRVGFYEGPTADAIVDAVRRDGGVLTHDDLLGYEVDETRPVRVRLGDAFGGRELLVMPPPSSGGVAIAQAFGVIDHLVEARGFTMPATGYPAPRDAHLLAETMKHAFAGRARHLADPAFADVPVDAMLDARSIADAAARIDPGTPGAAPTYGVHRPGAVTPALPEDGGTSHISVVDAKGNAVACTETINLSYGSMITAEGFCLNDEMDDFTTVRGATNAFGLAQSDDNLPQPGKRPLSSMSPTIVLDQDGSVFAVAGASGGPRIITATAQVLLRVLLADANAGDAVGAPRLHHQWQPDAVFLETGRFAVNDAPERDALRDAMERMGHETRERTDIGACQLIRRAVGGRYDAASDPRKGGRPSYERTTTTRSP